MTNNVFFTLVGILFWGIWPFGNTLAQTPIAIDTIQLDQTQLEVRVLAQNLFIPWDMDWANDGWLWFSERDGKISRIRPNSGFKQHVYTIEEAFDSGENSGMHALALHPEFPDVPYVYAHFTFWWTASKLVRYTFDEEFLTLKDPVIFLDSIPASSSHNGSRIVFSNDHQHLFLAMGDAYNPTQVQDSSTTNGKILRFNMDGTIPADNPFPGLLTWSLGHRNPQGLVMTPSGNLYNTEHGDASNDELNLVLKGRNYGWPKVEGACDFLPEQVFCEANNVVEPMYAWVVPTYAVCGMAYYDHEAIPEWQNSILVATLKAGEGGAGQRLQRFPLNAAGDSVKGIDEYFKYTFGRLRDVMVSPDGRVFVCTSNREVNGDLVVTDQDDQLIEIRNLARTYDDDLPLVENVFDYMWVGPSPLVESLNISLLFYQGTAEVDLLSPTGQLVWTESVSFDGAIYTLELPQLVSGVYSLRLRLADGRETIRKVMVR